MSQSLLASTSVTKIKVAGLSAVLLAFQAVSQAAPPHHTIIDLGTLGGTFSVPFGINAGGDVVGRSSNFTNETRAFLYKQGKIVGFDTFSSPENDAFAINALGHIVGIYFNNGGTINAEAIHAYLRTETQVVDLGSRGGVSYAFGINDSDQIVGTSYDKDNVNYHAVLYSNGNVIDLGTLGGAVSQAEAINHSGQIVGQAATATGEIHAFLLSAGHMIDLGTFGGAFGEAIGVNDPGQVVGRMTTRTGDSHAFIYSAGQLTDVGTLGGTFGQLNGINNAGEAVGQSTTAGDASSHAIMYSGGVVYDLTIRDSTQTITITGANRINDRGEIAAEGFVANGETHALLLEPVTDNTPPTIRSATANPSSIWPPNHKFIPIALSVDAFDASGITSAKIVSVSSNEPEANQWRVTGNLNLDLLANRDGQGTGRIYTIVVECKDALGNAARRSAIVAVPHDRK
jgi:probable HAF family extracellular repeat protein